MKIKMSNLSMWQKLPVLFFSCMFQFLRASTMWRIFSNYSIFTVLSILFFVQTFKLFCICFIFCQCLFIKRWFRWCFKLTISYTQSSAMSEPNKINRKKKYDAVNLQDMYQKWQKRVHLLLFALKSISHLVARLMRGRMNRDAFYLFILCSILSYTKQFTCHFYYVRQV